MKQAGANGRWGAAGGSAVEKLCSGILHDIKKQHLHQTSQTYCSVTTCSTTPATVRTCLSNILNKDAKNGRRSPFQPLSIPRACTKLTHLHLLLPVLYRLW